MLSAGSGSSLSAWQGSFQVFAHKIRHRNRLIEQVALRISTAKGFKQFQLFRLLHPFGNTVNTDFLTYTDQIRNQQPGRGVGIQIIDHAFVKFQFLERNSRENRYIAVFRTEIIQRETITGSDELPADGF